MLRARVDPPARAVVAEDDVQYELCIPLVNIRGESYRLKDKKRAGIFSAPPAKQDA